MVKIELIDETGDAARTLKTAGMTIAVAESCTGGLLSHKLTNIRGSSDFFRLGIVAYSSKIKVELLNLDKKLLEKHGAVSPEVAEKMAEGVARLADTDIGLSITGFADGDRAGEVYLGIYRRDTSTTLVKAYHFSGKREDVKEYAAMAALEAIASLINEGE